MPVEVTVRSLVLLLMVACSKAPPRALPSVDGPASYRVGVAVASGDRAVTSIYTLRAVPLGDQVWSFSTVHTEGSVETESTAITYNSEAPKGTDPWPLTLQHAISTVPAPVRLDDSGAPVELQQADAWRAAGLEAAKATNLPAQALGTANSLLDPEGYLRDLRRNFPGTPAADGSFVRTEDIAALTSRRVETCTREDRGPHTTWTCQGHIEGPTEGGARLKQATSRTVLTVDKRGLVELHAEYEGTMVMAAPDGKQVFDRPVAGQRTVIRVP